MASFPDCEVEDWKSNPIEGLLNFFSSFFRMNQFSFLFFLKETLVHSVKLYAGLGFLFSKLAYGTRDGRAVQAFLD